MPLFNELPRRRVFSETQVGLPTPTSWVLSDSTGLEEGLIAACWTGVLVLDSGKRGLEHDPDYRRKSPVLVLRVILGPQRFRQ